jgi:membrane-associated phospholipid phosphatase
MLFAIVHRLPADFWHFASRLGEMQLMLPIAFALIAWLFWAGEGRRAALWLAMVGLAVGITVASKIAFIGWGIGSARLDFTGFSGHAMHAAAVMPLLAGSIAAGSSRWVRLGAVTFALALAMLVAISRIKLGAHSPSEVLLGYLLGGLASSLALGLGHPPHAHPQRWLVASVFAALLLNSSVIPSLPTHDVVTRVALQLSGRDKPYTRHMMMRDEKLRQRNTQPVVAAPRYRASEVEFFTSSITA